MSHIRHPSERGTPLARWCAYVLNLVRDGHAWRRHPVTFRASRRGRERRAERLFAMRRRAQLLELNLVEEDFGE